ncbi:MAG: hypothetical protein QME73_11580, partial [Bacillota bacterium]|nr:hypothetical protein [Bacillota bacterium]
MKAINIVFIFVLTISLAGCSIMGSNAVEPENAEQNQDGENQDEKSDMSLSDSIDLYDMDMQTRIELGIALDYSPDGRHFFIKDKYGSNFIKVFLYEDGEKEIEIYDYCDFFGIIDLGARDMTEDRFFWGGMSDT